MPTKVYINVGLHLNRHIITARHNTDFIEWIDFTSERGSFIKYVTPGREGGGQMGCDKVCQGRGREFCNM